MPSFLAEKESAALRERLSGVLQRIADAAERSGRSPESVTLVCIAKKHSPEVVAELATLWPGPGPLIIGENYLQEGLEKQTAVRAFLRAPASKLPLWHFTGHLQSRKARDIPENFALLHTLDSEKLASALQKQLRLLGDIPPLPVLIQVNVGREPQKSGVLPEDAEALAKVVTTMPELALKGFMCIPPLDGEVEDSRRHFAALRTLRDTIAASLGIDVPELSMGMSHDLEAAIEEGATMVRVGTDIFGTRA
ncbi:YggS family pyridoxal phosphate-dependent enzyme [Desulfovibrio sp. OttesenSCG-928-I05]|nr:YggS family pyridoxal phosphate-dependent enzyme [Desulfovibrio sp. OttesenSCG-928-I05]